MAITYPLSLPDITRIMEVEITASSVVAESIDPFTAVSDIQEHSGQWWQAIVNLPMMQRGEAADWIAFRLKLNGKKGTFLLGDPNAQTPRGTPVGTPLVNGAQASQSAELSTKGWTANAFGVLLTGDYIQLGTGATARLHQILNDVTADASGLATIDIWPRLRASVTDGAAITTSNCMGVFRLASNTMPTPINVDGFYNLTFAAREVI